MAYPTILVHVDEHPRAAERIGVAVQLALAGGGHLAGVAATGVSRFLYHSMPPEQDDPTLALHLDMLREQARASLARFSAQCRDAGVASCEAHVLDDEAGAGISLRGRAADLIVIGQADPRGARGASDLPAYVISNSGRPVLLVPLAPHAGSIASVGQRILVSWDGGREAARALQLALPLLRQAGQIDLAVFEVAADEHTVADALAADPRPWLARHGVTATLAVHAIDHHRRLSRRHEVGERLLSLAAGSGYDLLVMGAYGHSRFRESLLGGVTRTVLEAMNLPVLMAH
ncbi:MAG: universal stress protein [Pseudomonadota bacterium]